MKLTAEMIRDVILKYLTTSTRTGNPRTYADLGPDQKMALDKAAAEILELHEQSTGKERIMKLEDFILRAIAYAPDVRKCISDDKCAELVDSILAHEGEKP